MKRFLLVLPFVLEAAAFGLVAAVAGVVFGPVWGLLPVAVYLFLAARGLSR